PDADRRHRLVWRKRRHHDRGDGRRALRHRGQQRRHPRPAAVLDRSRRAGAGYPRLASHAEPVESRAMPPREPVLSAAERERVLGLIDELMAPRIDAESAAAMRAKFDEHLAWLGDSLLGGVNPQRADGDHAWTEARGRALEPTINCGAVHLELGTEDAFPDERVHALRDEQGLSEFLRVDFDAGHRPDLVADVTALPLASGSIDRVVSASVCE